MITRVTSTMTALNTRGSIQDSSRTLAQLQEKASSRQAITRPSDDPAGARASIEARAEITRMSQYERNISDAQSWLTTIDSSLRSGTDLLVRAGELAIQGANGSMNDQSRAAAAAEVDQLLSQMVRLSDTQVAGRFIFAGTHAGDSVYSGAPATWNGAEGSSVQRRISDKGTIQVDVPGPAAFGNGEDSVFSALQRLADGLRSGTPLGGSIDEIESSRKRMVDALTTSGARHTTVNTAAQTVQLRLTELEADRARVEEVDLAEAAVDFQTQQVYYQAALAVNAKALQTSLLDYLR